MSRNVHIAGRAPSGANALGALPEASIGRGVNIRAAHPGDLAALMPLIVAHVAYEGDTWREHGQRQRLAQALFGHTPRLFCFMVFRDGQAVGYATASLEYSTWQARDYLHMDCLYLDQAVRGQGLGGLLFERLEALARQRGCDLIQWQTPASNELGQRFYAKLGASHKAKLRYYQPVSQPMVQPLLQQATQEVTA